MISNRRIPKTVCPVVWEAARAQSRAADPIPAGPFQGRTLNPHYLSGIRSRHYYFGFGPSVI
jgi:hypothetical protein